MFRPCPWTLLLEDDSLDWEHLMCGTNDRSGPFPPRLGSALGGERAHTGPFTKCDSLGSH